MRDALRPIVIVLACILVVSAAVGAVRWAKRHSTGAQVLASAMLLVLGIGVPVINPPQQGIEEAREDKGKKGAESGDPPAA
jgi:ABC-type amino acid transport system permease subunit